MRRRLVIAIVAVAAAAIALFAVPLGIVLAHGYREQELLRLQRDTVAAARLIDPGTSSNDPIELPPGGDRLAVYDVAGRRLAGAAGGPQRADRVVREALRTRRPAVRTPEGGLVAAVPLLSGERVTGVIRARRPDAAVGRRSRRAWLGLAGAALALVLLAGGAALLLGRRLAVPLERVASTARQLGEGDFSVRARRGGIDEVDAVADALDSTASRLGDLVARERAFSADASHQLRTPLAALRLELEALALAADLPGLGAAIAQVDRLAQTIDTLLAVARDLPRPHGSADLVALVNDLEARWRGPLSRENRPLRVSFAGLPGARASTRASRSIVGEILDVLVGNALHHGCGTVTVTVREVDEWLAIDVGDEGTGVSGNPESVFERRTAGGTGHGIGLALARSLAHAEGGRLTLSRAGPRPVFTLLLVAHARERGA